MMGQSKARRGEASKAVNVLCIQIKSSGDALTFARKPGSRARPPTNGFIMPSFRIKTPLLSDGRLGDRRSRGVSCGTVCARWSRLLGIMHRARRPPHRRKKTGYNLINRAAEVATVHTCP